jgi:GNAT superfamily N-acetyltransferase
LNCNLSSRRATVEDVPALVALVNSAYRGESSKQGWTTEADLLDGQRTDPVNVRSLLNDPGSAIILLFEGNEIVGSVLLQRDGDHAYLGMLTVMPTRQAFGLGRQLLARAEAFVLDQWGLSRIEMTVIQKRAELIAWYERRGYRLTGETRPFPYGDERFGLPKRDDLEFVVMQKSLSDP